MPVPDLMWAALAAALTSAAAILCAWILRGAGLAGGRPAAAVVGGVMGGLILGGVVFGRFAPQWHERIFRGGVEERAALQAAVRQDRAELVAMRAAGLDAAAISAAQTEQHRRRVPFVEALADAAAERRSAHRILALVVVSAAAAGAGTASVRTHRRPSRRTGGESRNLVAPFLFTAVPAMAMYATLRLLTGIEEPAALAAAGATGVGSMLLTPARWTPRRGRSPAIWTCVAVALTLGTAVVLGAALWARLQGQPANLVAALLVPLLWSAGALAGAAMGENNRPRRLARDIFLLLLAPAVIALPVAHLDLQALAAAPGRSNWAIVGTLLVAVIAAGDGRWLGAWIGFGLPKARPGSGALPRPVDRATETIAAGPLLTQAVFAAWLFSIGLLDPAEPLGALVTAALLLGPVLIEPLTGVYRFAAGALRRQIEGDRAN